MLTLIVQNVAGHTVVAANELAAYAAIPSREGLLTMLAAGLMGTVKDLSICLDLYAKQKEEN